jgi:hypothetical protein
MVKYLSVLNGSYVVAAVAALPSRVLELPVSSCADAHADASFVGLSKGNSNCALKSPHKYTTTELPTCVAYGLLSWTRVYILPSFPTGLRSTICRNEREAFFTVFATTGAVGAPAAEATESERTEVEEEDEEGPD